MPLIIGITNSYEDKFTKLNTDYLKIISSFGAISLIIPYSEKTGEILKITDGIILSGGGDLSEELILEKLSPMAKNVCPKRDIYESELCIGAYEKNIPVFGICRGVQVMNAAFGGKICQHIEGHGAEYTKGEKGKDILHKIKINKESRLYKAAGTEYAVVNSFHHQCISVLADIFIVSAKSADNVTEAVESPEKAFFAGVQWHPEKTPDDKLSRALFKRFINACEKTKTENKF